ncbi:MAG: cysteine--tRNA ligase [Bacteroidales bacterium]
MSRYQDNRLYIFNTLSRKKELFRALNPPHVGLYVCGPTVYGDPHLGHARPAVTFDLLFRYLGHLGYKVRYVRNITDVGHLESDADEGEDKVLKKARLEQLEPMEVVQQYTNSYHESMTRLNVLPPSIEPRASGHIIEQQLMAEKILERGYAYESNGSVYFDVIKYHKDHNYGKLSGRVLEDLISNARKLDSQDDKRNNVDFALWKKAEPSHIMRWPSRWSEGFPGWHLECSAMSSKYLGGQFDIHGGGMDLLFPHHECEIAQSVAANGKDAVRYWMHNNMVTINGQKMGKSLGNFITLDELFTGSHKLLDDSYSPMTIRFFMLQAHYGSTLDFSNEALAAARKGLVRLMSSVNVLGKIKPAKTGSFDVDGFEKKAYAAMNDDLGSPVLIAHLFETSRFINSAYAGKESITAPDLERLQHLFRVFVFDILGLKEEEDKEMGDLTSKLVDLLLTIRLEVKRKKDFELSDRIRNELAGFGITVKDKKDGFEWEIKE